MKQSMEREQVARTDEIPIVLTEEARSFVQEVIRRSGERVDWCYQCGKCTAGCPVAFAMDIEPSRIMRLVQLGQGERVLKSKAIWLCVGCQTCTTRCPQEIDPAKIMDTLREMALEEGYIADREVVTFFKSFLDNIRKFGRSFEPMLVLQYNLKSGHLFQDADKGFVLLSKGKLPLRPSHNSASVKQIFEALEGRKR
ncbi:MAG: 4Fe-4S dicluster domain-containing protein [Armatimonadota bacterium]|nr:4Fe-4S dicluster domain-containing protein [Armatimonadota bacterium]